MTDWSPHPFEIPAAWQTSDYPNKEAFAIRLSPYHIEVLKRQLSEFKRKMDTMSKCFGNSQKLKIEFNKKTQIN